MMVGEMKSWMSTRNLAGLGALDGHPGVGGLVRDEAAVLRVGAQFDDLDLVGHVAALAQPVPFLQPGVRGQFLAEADDDHVAVFVGTGGQLALDLFQVERGERDGRRGRS